MKKKPAAHEIPEATAVPEHLKNAPNTAEATAGPAKQTAEDSAGNTAMGQNRAQDTMNELKRMEKNGRPYPLMKYKQRKSWQAKREFASKLQLDKTASWLGVEEAEYLKEKQNYQRSCWMVLLVGRGALEQHTLQLLGPRTDEVPQVLGGWVPRERSRRRRTAAARA